MRCDVVGCMFIFVSAFLYAARYIATAIFMVVRRDGWSERLFKESYDYIGNGLTVWAILALGAGLAVIAVGTVHELSKAGDERNKSSAGDT